MWHKTDQPGVYEAALPAEWLSDLGISVVTCDYLPGDEVLVYSPPDPEIDVPLEQRVMKIKGI
jgi:hypothetical protein